MASQAADRGALLLIFVAAVCWLATAGAAAPPLLGLNAKCKPPKTLDDANPCASGLFCTISNSICAKQLPVPAKAPCFTWLPNRPCIKGYHCKPDNEAAPKEGKRAPGTCQKQLESNAECKLNGPDDQCVPGESMYGPSAPGPHLQRGVPVDYGLGPPPEDGSPKPPAPPRKPFCVDFWV